MKFKKRSRYHNYSFLLILGMLIFLSCGKDKTQPTISENFSDSSIVYTYGSFLKGEVIASDNRNIESLQVLVFLNDKEIFEETKNSIASGATDDVSISLPIDLQLLEEESGQLRIDIVAFDAADNLTEKSKSYTYDYYPNGTLNLNINLVYNDNPLILFTGYEYPDGRSMDFTRFSFFASDVKLDDKIVEDISFHNLTNTQADPDLAVDGYDWNINYVKTGIYNNLSFGLGVSEDLNSQDPGSFSSGHPLARPSEHWFSWNSFIFLKLEGNIDLDNDGAKETGIALHLGADEAFKNIVLDKSFTINEGISTTIPLEININDFFNGSQGLYDIDSNPQIHSLDQLDQVDFLINNFTIK